ncbi:unnamed protein product [Rotaria sordida]|uniref:Uncharacterized protein n=1 Tax=Rotaria sordida TaxID=392033 RepID=A0A813TCY1_9BILA|nr:unnamed protein product [Rotaria sordida]CAF3693746.1 unnamed protein product [Rotaria sordida]
MDRVVTKTVDALNRFGERLERRFSTGDDDDCGLERSGSGHMHLNSGSAFHRPMNSKYNSGFYHSSQHGLAYGGVGNYASDNLAGSPGGHSSFLNYRQGPMGYPHADGMARPPYGTGIGGPMDCDYGGAYPGPSPAVPYGGARGSIGYAPDYYIAERRQVDLVPAPPPRYIREPVPVPFPVDRPVPQPYPVEVPRPVPVDRPVPVPVPSPVYVDRPVPVPVRVPVPSPPIRVPVPVPVPSPPIQVRVPVPVPSPPVQVPVPVPSPVPCYIPVGVPVPSPPPSPTMVENSVTHSQRWTTSSPAMMHQRCHLTGSPVMMNQQRHMAGSPVMMNQQRYMAGSPVMMNQQRYMAGSPVMCMNPCVTPYGNGSFFR